MGSVFKSLTSSSKNKGVIIIKPERDDWKLPNKPIHAIYKQEEGMFGMFGSSKDYKIYTIEETVPLDTTLETLRLLRRQEIHTHKGKYNYLHLGSVQVGIKPVQSLGPDKSILLCLRDSRFLNFDDSLLAGVESSLSHGSLYFNCFPNICVPLTEPNIMDVLTLNVKANGFNLKEKSLPMILVYRVVFKLMSTPFSPKYVGPVFRRGETRLVQDSGGFPIVVRWDEIQFPETWRALQSEVPSSEDEKTSTGPI